MLACAGLTSRVGCSRSIGQAASLEWAGCDGLANAAEHDYPALHASYPCALWVVAHASNVSQWLDSLKHQLQKNVRRHGRAWRCPAAQRIFGRGNAIAARVERDTGRAPPDGCAFDATYHAAFYRSYYAALFAFLANASVPYRRLDVRHGDGWASLGGVRGRCPLPNAPFPSANSRSAHTGDYVGRCTPLDPSHGWLSRLLLKPSSSRPRAEREEWAAC